MATKGIEFGKAFLTLSIDDNTFSRGLARARRDLRLMGRGLANVGAALTVSGGAIATPIVVASKAFADFDDQIRSVYAVIASGNQGDFVRLADQARELGRTTSFTATEVAKLQLVLAKRGFKNDAIETMTGSILNLARATGETLPNAALFATSALKEFELGEDQIVRVTDALVASANNSANSLQGMHDGLRKAGIVAKQFNISMEETAAALGVMSEFALIGEEGGVALRRVLLNLADAGKQAKLKDILDIELNDTKLRSISSTLGEIGQKLKLATVNERNVVLNTLFGARGFNAAAVIESNTVQIDKLVDTIKNLDGVAERTAKAMDAGLGGAFRIAYSAAQDLILAIGKDLEQTSISFLNVVRDVSNTTTKWLEANAGTILTIVKLTTAGAAFGATLIGIGITLQLISFAMFGWVALLSLFAGGLAGATIHLTLFAGAAKLIGSTFSEAIDGVTEFAKVAFDGIDDVLGLTKDLGKAIEGLGETFATATAGIREAVKTNDFQAAGEIAGLAFQLGMKQALAPVVNLPSELATSFAVFIVEIQAKFAKGMASVRATVENLFQSALQVVKTMILNAVDGLRLAILFVLEKVVSVSNLSLSKLPFQSVIANKIRDALKELQAGIKSGIGDRTNLSNILFGSEEQVNTMLRLNRELARIEKDRVGTIKELEKAQRDKNLERTKELTDKIAELTKELNDRAQQAKELAEVKKLIDADLNKIETAEKKDTERQAGPGLPGFGEEDIETAKTRAKELSKSIFGGIRARETFSIRPTTQAEKIAEKQVAATKEVKAAVDVAMDRYLESARIQRERDLAQSLAEIAAEKETAKAVQQLPQHMAVVYQ